MVVIARSPDSSGAWTEVSRLALSTEPAVPPVAPRAQEPVYDAWAEVLRDSSDLTSPPEPPVAVTPNLTLDLDEAAEAPEAEPVPGPEAGKPLITRWPWQKRPEDDSLQAEPDTAPEPPAPAAQAPRPAADPPAPPVTIAPPAPYEPVPLALQDYECGDCVYYDRCPRKENDVPATCGQFQWRS